MSSLKEAIAERKRELEKERAAAPSCCEHASRMGGANYIEFRPDAHTRTGFPAQLCHYTLEDNAGGDKDTPERLTLAFHSADVVLVGARLSMLVELVTTNQLGSVTALDARYAEALGKNPWVAKITIKFLGKAQAQNTQAKS
jgi:hypothetical protein